MHHPGSDDVSSFFKEFDPIRNSLKITKTISRLDLALPPRRPAHLACSQEEGEGRGRACWRGRGGAGRREGESEAGQLTVFTRRRSWRRRRGGGGLWRRLAQLRRAPRPARSRLGLPFVSPRLIYVPWRGITRGWPLPDIRGALQGPWEE